MKLRLDHEKKKLSRVFGYSMDDTRQVVLQALSESRGDQAKFLELVAEECGTPEQLAFYCYMAGRVMEAVDSVPRAMAIKLGLIKRDTNLN